MNALPGAGGGSMQGRGNLPQVGMPLEIHESKSIPGVPSPAAGRILQADSHNARLYRLTLAPDFDVRKEPYHRAMLQAVTGSQVDA